MRILHLSTYAAPTVVVLPMIVNRIAQEHLCAAR
jgi:hypothetical protein